MKNFILLLLISLASGQFLFAQSPPAGFTPAPTAAMNTLSVAFKVFNLDPPDGVTTDFVAAVDADDANVLLGVDRAAADGAGGISAYLEVNPPTGASNSFHLVYYDVTTGLYHVLQDANNVPLTIVWQAGDSPTFVDGYEISNMGVFPGAGIPLVPGETTMESIIGILPIDLTLFTARQSDKFVALNWTTASEDGNASFSVERSADGVEFISLGEVSGAGTSRQAIDYTFNDEAPLRGQNYYRLRQNDFSGSYSYSDVVVVSFEGGNQIGLEVSPNPATDHVRVQLTGEWLETARVMLTDLNGKMIADLKYVTTSSFDVELSHLPAGIYQLQVTDGNNRLTQRVIVR